MSPRPLRRSLAVALLLASLAACSRDAGKAASTPADADGGKGNDAASVHARALVIDGHMDTPLRLVDLGFDLGNDDPTDNGHISLDKIERGNLGAGFFSIWVDPQLNGKRQAHRALEMIDSVHEQVRKHPDRMLLATSADDVERAHREGKFAALIGIEGGGAIENSLALLRDYHRLGVRYMTLTWSQTIDWADSSGDATDPSVTHHGGLTDFGREVVREMNRLGMLVDVSHVADDTFWDVIETSAVPVIASHSSARALTDSPRNMTDDMLRAMATNGGVVMVNYYAGFIDDDYRKASAQLGDAQEKAVQARLESVRAEGREPSYGGDIDPIDREFAAKLSRPPFKALIDHIDHVAKVAGIDHVGLGSDFDGVAGALPQGIDSAADLPKITEALLARGYDEAAIGKILGGNVLRVMRAAESHAHKSAQAP